VQGLSCGLLIKKTYVRKNEEAALVQLTVIFFQQLTADPNCGHLGKEIRITYLVNLCRNGVAPLANSKDGEDEQGSNNFRETLTSLR